MSDNVMVGRSQMLRHRDDISGFGIKNSPAFLSGFPPVTGLAELGSAARTTVTLLCLEQSSELLVDTLLCHEQSSELSVDTLLCLEQSSELSVDTLLCLEQSSERLVDTLLCLE